MLPRQNLLFDDSCSQFSDFDNEQSFRYLFDSQKWLYPSSEDVFEKNTDYTEKIVEVIGEPIKKWIVKIKKGKKNDQQKIKKGKKNDQQKTKNGVYMLPGESKNIPKNYTRALKHFIITHFDSSVLQNPEIRKFLGTKPEKACKQTLENSLKNCQLLKQISQMFFGNVQWSTIFLEENKVDLEQYFRFNQVWFGSKN